METRNETSFNKFQNIINKNKEIECCLNLLNQNIIPKSLWNMVQNIYENIIFIEKKNKFMHIQISKIMMVGDCTSYNYE